MGLVLLVGCLLVAFGAPLAIFVVLVAPDPLRIILFILGAFLWLVSLFCSALLWFALYPLRDALAFTLFFTVTFQELLRFAYFYLLKLAQRGLEKVSSAGLHISGVHSLKDARHTTALVCGLGWAVMNGLFAVLNVAADSSGSGVPGVKNSLCDVLFKNGTVQHDCNGMKYGEGFFLFCSVCVAAMTLLQALWTVLSWDAFHDIFYVDPRMSAVTGTEPTANVDGSPPDGPQQVLVQGESRARRQLTKFWKPIVQLSIVYASHYFLAYLSLLNQVSGEWQIVYVCVLYLALSHTLVWSYCACGGSPRLLWLAVKNTPRLCIKSVRRPADASMSGEGGAAADQHQAPSNSIRHDEQNCDVRKRRAPEASPASGVAGSSS